MRKMMVYAVLALSASFPAWASELPSIPEKPDLKRYESVPAPWHDYLLQARAADRIVDPLERCLAFPDLPGNKWPNGHAEAHCLIHHEGGIPTVAGIGESLDRGELPQLEASMRLLLDRHYSTTDYSEAIHELFNYRFDAGEASDQVSARWLGLSPDSAFAHLARASYLASAAIKTRGAGFAATVPREDFRRMTELSDQAISQYREAIRINPKLIAAHTGMLQVAMFDSRDEVESEAFAAANRLDPACAELANVHMRSLTPRWGGDYEQMLVYANALAANVARRPQLALQMAKPYSDRGEMLSRDEQFTKEALDVLEIAIGIGSEEDALAAAANVAPSALGEGPGDIKRLAYLLQESRYKALDAWSSGVIASRLITFKPLAEPEWSLKYSLRAVELQPDDMSSRYNVGAAYQNMNRFDDAEREFLVVMEGPDAPLHQEALRSLAEFRLWGGDTRKPDVRKANVLRAKPYIDRLLKEYPDDGRGWIMRVFQRGFMDPRMDAAALDGIRAAVKRADPSDPWQMIKVERLKTMLKIEDSKQQSKPRK